MLSDETYDLFADRMVHNGYEYASTHDYRENPLSGEWADEPTDTTILLEIGLNPTDLDPNDWDALATQWLMGYNSYWDTKE